MKNFKKNIISKLPSSFYPNFKEYNEIRSLIKKTENFTKDEFENFQFEQLKEIVNYAWNNSIGYREYWKNNNFYPSILHDIKDIKKIPIIEKSTILNNVDLFSVASMIPHAIKVSTGGSSGHPFTFYNMKENRAIEHGFITDMWSAFFPEITVKTKRTFLRGGIIDNGMEYDPLFGLKLSSRNINEDLAHQFIKAIDKYRFPIFHVYPSSLYILCQTMLKYGINRPKHFFNSINYGSEPLYEFQLELIQKIFNEPYSICYGSTEKVVLAGNCANSNNYHIYPQYGFTEIIKGNGDSAKEGELGEIIGTSFHNRVTPFIRYKTEDFAIVGGDKCEFCNRNYQLLNSIEGRLQEFVVSQNKTLVSMTCVAGSAHDETFNTIKQFRFEQREIGKVAFLFIPHDGQKVNTELLTKKLEDILGEKFHLTVRKVDKIDLTNAGKMSYLNQHLNINEFML